MRTEVVSERADLVIRRLVLEPGEATPWHTDSCHRFTVVVRGDRLALEFADGGDASVEVAPGLAGWDPPEPRAHRAVNVGNTGYEEVVTFYRSGSDVEPQPMASSRRRQRRQPKRQPGPVTIGRRGWGRLTAVAAGALMAAGIEAAPTGAPPAAGEPLARMTLELTDERPYRFVLAYHGPLMPFRGLVCYHFAGYNETCLDPHIDWLTPATEIRLHAPGGVPRDLLEGYVMLVRYPALSEDTFRYALSGER